MQERIAAPMGGLGRMALSIAAAALWCASAQGQARPEGVRHVAAADVSAALAKRASGVPETLWAGRDWRIIALQRDRDGEAEVHAGDADLFIVTGGSAVVIVGGRVTGDRETGPGERRGGRIEGGERITLASGDQLMIPAGIPHQVLPDAGARFDYMVVKLGRTVVASPPPDGAP